MTSVRGGGADGASAAAAIRIDRESGMVVAGDLVVAPDLRLSALPEWFGTTPERAVMVLGESVPCQFAAAQFVDNGRPIRLELRFERGVLVSCFFTFPNAPPDAERQICAQWLTDQIGYGGGSAEYAWGCAGVATDKSDNSWVFLHNRNNSWAW